MAAGFLKRFLLRLPGFEGACLRLTRDRERVLMYHRFTDDPAAEPDATPADRFARQLDLLQARCRVVGPAALVDQQEGRRPRSRRPLAVVTVDDGYADFERVAFPVLQARGLPAVLFVTTEFVAGWSWMWWDKVHYALARAGAGEAAVTVAGRTVRGPLRTRAERGAFWFRLVPALRFVADERKEEVIADLAGQLGVTLPAEPPPEFAASTWEGIVAMARAGIVMGSHTRTHPILSRVDRARARQEIEGSRDDLAGHLGEPVRWFAYPQGGPADYDDQTVEIVAGAGFDRAWVAYTDPALGDHPYRRPRHMVPADLEEFRWSVCGAEHLVLRLKAALGRPTGVSDGYWTGSDLAAALNAEGKEESV